ncbi:capsular polysaccharide synthesis protein [Limosilactobacillus pontis]|uniref:capsular polysaccharide synthesis protein n=1 Tax=Limosilactobacillus pontis TaxID=35787 RepID=UPI002F2603E8
MEAVHSAWIYKKIKKRYKNSTINENTTNDKWKNKKMPKVIWWCWLQGEDNIPELPKICLKSIREKIPDYKVIVVSLDNLDDYIELPEIIVTKFKAGWISGAQFSDVVRLALLAKYGGIWIDSTVYCTDDRMIKTIESNDMFMYQNLMSSNSNIIRMSSWLMATKKDNPMFEEASSLLNDYYESTNYTEDYYVCHLILTLLVRKYSELWDKMDVFNNTDPHMLQLRLNDQFSLDVWNRILMRSSFHKLNRHLSMKESDTFYNHIKNEEGLCEKR